MAFLTARWSNLCLLTYAVPRRLLGGRLPPGLELDRHSELPGEAFVSLVAFDFVDTRVLGVPWPGFRDFPELNLRFYVRRPTENGYDRGVMFVREFVRQRFVAWVARTVYNEPYVVAPLESRVIEAADSLAVEHRLTFGGRTHAIAMTGDKPSACPAEGTIEHFFKEQQWGYGRSRGGNLLRYEVVHPPWECYRVRSWHLDLDWTAVYGPEWGWLASEQPCSTMLAAGSGISVHPKVAVRV